MKGVPELREFHIVPGNVIESAFCRPRIVAESRSLTRLPGTRITMANRVLSVRGGLQAA